jgi:hypothetical protein
MDREKSDTKTTHRVPNVLHDLEPLLHRGIGDWMNLVTPRREWEVEPIGRSGNPMWWTSFRDDVRMAYRDAANRFVRASLKAQVDVAAPKVNVTQRFLHEIALVSGARYYKSFDDFAGSSESVINTLRTFMQSRGAALNDPEFEPFREAGVGGAMRYIRYRYLAKDEWYSTWHQERAVRASAQSAPKKVSGKRAKSLRTPRDSRYLKDWVRTSPPHYILLPALRVALLRQRGIRPEPPFSARDAALIARGVAGFWNASDADNRPPWAAKSDEGAALFAEQLNLWHAPFVLTVFCMDHLRLANSPQ